jgi:hypothetical protein
MFGICESSTQLWNIIISKVFLLSDKSTGLPCERIVDYEGAKVCVYKKTKGAGKGKGQDLF